MTFKTFFYPLCTLEVSDVPEKHTAAPDTHTKKVLVKGPIRC